ncbi:MAG: hypothetical protein QOH36_1512 [Actinomycetota bacterium]|nr:hypothetical protein [Actinomycetota bacterium]
MPGRQNRGTYAGSSEKLANVRAFGWRHTFIEKDWADVRGFLAGVSARDGFEYLLEIIDSVVSSGADDVLAITTSMHDLVVALKPVAEPPLDVLIVCAPGSMRSHPDGTVRIEHLSTLGRDTKIVRPSQEAVRLFWRFLDVEFGLHRSI